MLTCYDFPTAQLLNQSNLDLILVGDSLGNVLLGYDSTIPVSLNEMIIFGKAVRRGAPEKFIVLDAPFATYSTFTSGIKNLSQLFKETQCEAIKIEGASSFHLKLIDRLIQTGVPVMGHIGLKPQSVHVHGGYKLQGKTEQEKLYLLEEAKRLEEIGVFCIVLECVNEDVAKEITDQCKIPTIGIGSGIYTDGQVLVYHDLMGLTSNKVPSFVTPMGNLFEEQKKILNKYLLQNNNENSI